MKIYKQTQITRMVLEILKGRRNNCLLTLSICGTIEEIYVMLCILYLKSTHKNSLWKTNKYRLIDASLIPEDQI